MGQSAAKINERLSVDRRGIKQSKVTVGPQEAKRGRWRLEILAEVTSLWALWSASANTGLISWHFWFQGKENHKLTSQRATSYNWAKKGMTFSPNIAKTARSYGLWMLEGRQSRRIMAFAGVNWPHTATLKSQRPNSQQLQRFLCKQNLSLSHGLRDCRGRQPQLRDDCFSFYASEFVCKEGFDPSMYVEHHPKKSLFKEGQGSPTYSKSMCRSTDSNEARSKCNIWHKN